VKFKIILFFLFFSFRYTQCGNVFGVEQKEEIDRNSVVEPVSNNSGKDVLPTYEEAVAEEQSVDMVPVQPVIQGQPAFIIAADQRADNESVSVQVIHLNGSESAALAGRNQSSSANVLAGFFGCIEGGLTGCPRFCLFTQNEMNKEFFDLKPITQECLNSNSEDDSDENDCLGYCVACYGCCLPMLAITPCICVRGTFEGSLHQLKYYESRSENSTALNYSQALNKLGKKALCNTTLSTFPSNFE
jgi:hypothetical protein